MFRTPWYQPVWDPQTETQQNNLYNGYWADPGPDLGPRHNAPRELPFREQDPATGTWYQGPKVLRQFRPNHYFTRPHDGKRPGAFGRLKDGLTNKGADVFVTTSGDKRTLMRDRPQKWQWSGWPMNWDEFRDKVRYDRDFRRQDLQQPFELGWTGKKRFQEPHYNFRNRKFESPGRVWSHPQKVWRDAHWPEGAHQRSRQPLSYRDLTGQWYSSVSPFVGLWPGGRPALP